MGEPDDPSSAVVPRGGGAPPWASEWGLDARGAFAVLRVGTATQRMRWVPAGQFVRGSPVDEPERHQCEVQHQVTLTRGFWMADTPVTQELWSAVTGDNPSSVPDDSELGGAARLRPVDRVSWQECVAFCERLNRGWPKPAFGLPTEAQWEFACRAGTEGPRYHDEIDEVAWYRANSGGMPHPVAGKAPNSLGLYDMLGNVWEWCADGGHLYEAVSQRDPVGAWTSSARVFRGGSWETIAGNVRAAFRCTGALDHQEPGIGLRIVETS